MRELSLSVAFLALSIGSASSACTKPSGIYVGSGTGQVVNANTGYITNLLAISLTVNVNSTSNTVTAYEKSKYLSTYSTLNSYTTSGTYNFTNSTSSCGGVVTLNGIAYQYNSANSGNDLTFIYYNSDPNLVGVNLVLKKV